MDTETGKVDVLEFVSCHDVGKAINRNSVLGQFYGGVAMGLGYGLLEEFDYEDAVPKQLNFDEYLIATAMDVPKIKGIIVENADTAGPFGAKSVGEPANEIAAPAIVNAIYNRQTPLRDPGHARTGAPGPQADPQRRARLGEEGRAGR